MDGFEPFQNIVTLVHFRNLLWRNRFQSDGAVGLPETPADSAEQTDRSQHTLRMITLRRSP